MSPRGGSEAASAGRRTVSADLRSLSADLAPPGFTQDPYPAHARLRELDGLHWAEAWGAWVATRYEDVAEGLRMDGTCLSAVGQTSAALAHLSASDRAGLGSIERLFSAGLLWSDPPEHDRIRSIVNKALNPRHLERMRPAVTATIERAAAALPEHGPFDVVDSFASPVPVAVLVELLGIPSRDVGMVRRWADSLADFMGSPKPTLAQARSAQDVVLAARAYIDGLIATGPHESGEGVIARLAALRAGGAEISDDELHATIVVLLVGGHRTTAAAIASAILALARLPDWRAAIRADAALLARASEELLRHESPHQRTVRIVRRETTLAGTTLHEGDVVHLLNGAANRDDRRFSDAKDLRLDRSPNRHLTFSSGIHFCIGAPLARIELAEALRVFLDRYPDFHLVQEPAWLDNHTLRTLTALWVEPESGRV